MSNQVSKLEVSFSMCSIKQKVHIWKSGPISSCTLNVMVLLKRHSTKWIYTSSLNRKLYGLDGPLKSFTKFLDQMKLLAMIVHGIVFNLIVKQYQILKYKFFGKTEISPYLRIFKLTCGLSWFNGQQWPHQPPPPSSYAPVIDIQYIASLR